MNARLYASLDKAIQDWMDEECCADDWPDIIIGDKTAEHMSLAARTVFEACEESQAFALREGYVKTV